MTLIRNHIFIRFTDCFFMFSFSLAPFGLLKPYNTTIPKIKLFFKELQQGNLLNFQFIHMQFGHCLEDFLDILDFKEDSLKKSYMTLNHKTFYLQKESFLVKNIKNK